MSSGTVANRMAGWCRYGSEPATGTESDVQRQEESSNERSSSTWHVKRNLAKSLNESKWQSAMKSCVDDWKSESNCDKKRCVPVVPVIYHEMANMSWESNEFRHHQVVELVRIVEAA